MFDDELMIGCVRAQANRLKEILHQMENDEKWKDHVLYYAKEMHEVEKGLRGIRRTDLESMKKFR